MESSLLSGINRQRISQGTRLLVFLLVLLPLTAQAGLMDEIEKLKDQIYSTSGINFPPGNKVSLKSL